MAKPELLKMAKLAEISIQKYERYLPSAFDGSLSMQEKVNKMVELFNQLVSNYNVFGESIQNTINAHTQNIEAFELSVNGALDAFVLNVNQAIADQELTINEIRNDFTIFQGLIETEFIPQKMEEQFNSWVADGTWETLINSELYDLVDVKYTEVTDLMNGIQQQFDTVVSGLTVDDEVILARQSLVKGKTFPTLDGRLEALDSDTYVPMKNEILNGDFSQGTAFWQSRNASFTTNTGVAEFTANTQGGGIQQTVTGKVGNIYYISAKVKTLSNQVRLYLYGGSFSGFTLGTNVFERLSVLLNLNVSPFFFGVEDRRTTGFGLVSVDDYLIINLTEVFGAGNEPTKTQMDALLATYPNSWFDGTVNLAENKRIIPFLLKRLELKADKAQEAWITPTLLNGFTPYVESVFSSPRYRKNTLGKIELSGILASGSNGAVAFSLPTGYRPSKRKYLSGATAVTSSTGNVEVHNNGNIIPLSFNTYISLDGMTFDLD